MNTDRSAIHNPNSKILWLVVVSTLLYVVAIWLDVTPLLRGPAEWPDEWRWSLRSVDLNARLLVPLATLSLYVVLSGRWLTAFDNGGSTRRREIGFLLFLTLFAPIIQLALAVAVARYPLNDFFAPTLSPLNSGYFSTALDVTDIKHFLSNYVAIMPTLGNHPQTHPPGPVLMHWLSLRFFEAWPALANSIAMPLRTLQCNNPGIMALEDFQIASATMGMVVPVIGALAVWPLYALGKRVANSKIAAATAALFPVMPLFAMWPTQWDQIYPLLLFGGLYLIHTGLEARSLWRIFFAGVSLSIATFFSVGNAVLMVIVGVYGIAWFWLKHSIAPQRFSVAQWVRLVIAFIVGCASIWIAYAVLYHVNPLDVISTGSRLAFESTTGNRSYLTWLLWNPIDFATFLGVPIVILLVVNRVRARRFPQRLRPLIITTFGSFILLDLSGIVRGEVGRLWIYFGPLFVLIALTGGEDWREENDSQHAMHSVRHSWLVTYPILLIALLALQLLTMNTRWLVSDSFLGEPPDRAVNFSAPTPSRTVSQSFDGQIALPGYDARASANSLELTLYWQALAQPPHAYTVFAHVLDANGQQVGQKDNMPVRDQLPTSCWQPGEYVTDPYSITLKSGARAPFTVEVGLYRLENGERLPLDDGSGTSVRLKVP